MPVKTPVRIYILWHASFNGGLKLARHIYYWFRLSNGEGIPIYFRSWFNSPDETLEIPDDSCDLNIVVPLVEPHMVATLPWRRYIESLTRKCEQHKDEAGIADYVILPVALHTTAYQMPAKVSRLNFMRHIDSDQENSDDVLLTKLTEAICLLLRNKVDDASTTEPIKIFLSHAKADGTEVPKLIKDFIQTETQCHSFFDENDISYGHDFSEVIQSALKTESAGLLVVQGDHYADRPWCRKEIRDFLKPYRITKGEFTTGHILLSKS